MKSGVYAGSHKNLSHIHRDAEHFRGGAVAALDTTLEARLSVFAQQFNGPKNCAARRAPPACDARV